MKRNWNDTKIESIPKRHLFPYEYVKPQSKVCIYGLGQQGMSYVRQLQATGYCEIIAVSDKDDSKKDLLLGKFIRWEDIKDSDEIDYYIIAIDDNYIASDIFWDFYGRGIKKDKIINIYLRQRLFPMRKTEVEAISDYRDKIEEDRDNLYIAIEIKGGIGDNIISLSFVRRLMDICHNLILDIYTDQYMAVEIFADELPVRNIYRNTDVIKYKYDIVFRLRQLIHVIYMNKKKVRIVSPILFEKVCSTIAQRNKDGLKDEGGKDINIIRRANLLGVDRYGMLGDGDIWTLSQSMSRIVTSSRNKNGKSYMTIGTGAGVVQGYENKNQTKEWNKTKYDELIHEIKKNFPWIRIVQIADAKAEKLKGADEFIFGMGYEAVKHILSGSVLHIGTEGGMVHLATQLGIRCIVLFGPTPKEYYGYPQNINISCGNCGGCMGLTDDWYTKCPLHDNPVCMSAISVEVVMGYIQEYLER